MKLALTIYTIALAFGFFQFGAASVKPVREPFAVETQVAMSQPLPDFIHKHRKDIAILSAVIPETALRRVK